MVSPGEVPEDRIYFGAWVRLEGEDGALACYRLVGPDETDAAQGLISIESPLGRVLVGREVGDDVVVERPAGRHSFMILEIRYGTRPAGR